MYVSGFGRGMCWIFCPSAPILRGINSFEKVNISPLHNITKNKFHLYEIGICFSFEILLRTFRSLKNTLIILQYPSKSISDHNPLHPLPPSRLRTWDERKNLAWIVFLSIVAFSSSFDRPLCFSSPGLSIRQGFAKEKYP